MHPLDNDAREAAERAEKLRAKVELAQQRKDVQAVLATEQGRRVVFAFLQVAGVDRSPLRNDPSAMGHAIGWQDAGRYWLDLIRSHCPEREAQMRAEAKRDAHKDEDDNDE